ncbi:MAG TPA: DPP IV N-terminal domain-containing protein [Longimicrobiales bacterium]
MMRIQTCSAHALMTAVLLAGLPLAATAQDRLPTYPGYDQYSRMAPQYNQAMVSGSVLGGFGATSPKWSDDGKTFEYTHAGKRYVLDVTSREVRETTLSTPPAGAGRAGRAAGPPRERGRQFTTVISPDSSRTALFRDYNVVVKNADGTETQVTTEGSAASRRKFGSASWVYGEELDVINAMWWSPDSRKLAYYGFDDTPVPDYYLQLDQTKMYSKIDTEAYPKAGFDNPIVDLYVYDAVTGKSTKIDVRDGKPFANETVGYYVYDVAWSPDGKEITFNRTNRRQNTLEYTACSPETGKCRVIVHDEWLPSWFENHPTRVFLADNKRFIWESPRNNGFANYYLYDMSGKLITPLTNLQAEVAGIVNIDEKAGVMYYMARDGDNYMKTQLHRVGLNGKNDVRLTDPKLTHQVSIAPGGAHIVDVAQAYDTPPVSRLLDRNGKVLKEFATSDVSKMTAAGIKPAERFEYTAADGKTKLYGMINKPSNFDPNRRYPVLFSVYGGPNTNGARETFGPSSAMTEYGFLVVTLDTRSATGLGKHVLDAIYKNLGVTEIDDMAAASKELAKLPYVDGTRVGIFGTSYGGYASAMALLRHPEAFYAAAAQSPVTSWDHYDTIYTERYMSTPQDNKAGYEAGSAMTYAANLKGRLMLYYGTADNNVHPNNMMQLIRALQSAKKNFEVQVGPDAGHSAMDSQRMMEFFIENLVMKGNMATN